MNASFQKVNYKEKQIALKIRYFKILEDGSKTQAKIYLHEIVYAG